MAGDAGLVHFWFHEMAEYLSDLPERRKGHTREIFLQILKAYLVGDLGLQEATARAAAATFNVPVLNEGCYGLWSLLLSAASEIPSRSLAQRLADLMASLARLPDARNEGETPLLVSDFSDGGKETRPVLPGEAITFYNGVFWRDLPGFGTQMRETWNGPSDHAQVDPETGADLRFTEWTNVNVFAACLVNSYACELSIAASYRKYGLWSISGCLETDFDPEDRRGRGRDYGPAQIGAVHAWLEIAGEDMARLVGSNAVGGGKDLWDSRRPYHHGKLTLDRWEFWKERLRALSSDQRMTGERQRVAAESLRMMEGLEVPSRRPLTDDELG